jgi:tetratricopeptide (TPR) repeat protein
MEIKIKNKISEQFDSPDCKSFLTLSFRLCFSVLVVCILASFGYAEILSEDANQIDILESSLLTDLEDIDTSVIPIDILSSDQRLTEISSNIVANLAARVDAKSSDLVIAGSAATDPGRQLWQAGISVSGDIKSGQNKNELQELIKQINSIEFKSPDQALEPLIVVEPAGKAESNEPLSDKNSSQKTKPEKSATIPQESLDSGQQDEKQITKKTMQLFEQVSQQPQQIKNPFELAEILFRGGQLKEAAKCYKEALNYLTADANSRNENKAWILFQIGNCLQKDDPTAAMQMYKQLIMECPNSPWTDLAKAKSNLIDWYLKEKPDTLINGHKL